MCVDSGKGTKKHKNPHQFYLESSGDADLDLVKSEGNLREHSFV